MLKMFYVQGNIFKKLIVKTSLAVSQHWYATSYNTLDLNILTTFWSTNAKRSLLAFDCNTNLNKYICK